MTENLHYKILVSLGNIRLKHYSVPLGEEDARNDEKRPGYLLVYGFDTNNRSHNSNVRNGTKHPLVGSQVPDDLKTLLEHDLLHVDGAVFIGKDNILYRVGAHLLNNVPPERVAEQLELQLSDEDWETFGFAHPVNTRHLNAIYGSFLMPETRFYTMSGKTGDIRVYADGRIIKSTIPEEKTSQMRPYNRLEALVA